MDKIWITGHTTSSVSASKSIMYTVRVEKYNNKIKWPMMIKTSTTLIKMPKALSKLPMTCPMKIRGCNQLLIWIRRWTKQNNITIKMGSQSKLSRTLIKYLAVVQIRKLMINMKTLEHQIVTKLDKMYQRRRWIQLRLITKELKSRS